LVWKKWIGGTPLEHPSYSPDLDPMRFLGFSNHEKGAPRQINLEVINGLQHVFEKWMECSKKYVASQRRYFEKETVTAPPRSFYSEY
jgi:hypothetical protein